MSSWNEFEDQTSYITILICGGRNFLNRTFLYQTMDEIQANLDPAVIRVIHGAARGADTLGGEWARKHNHLEVKCPADWRRYGRAAGYKRNQSMIDEHHVDMVVAFPGGRGTADMVRRAKAAGIPVQEPKPEEIRQ